MGEIGSGPWIGSAEKEPSSLLPSLQIGLAKDQLRLILFKVPLPRTWRFFSEISRESV